MRPIPPLLKTSLRFQERRPGVRPSSSARLLYNDDGTISHMVRQRLVTIGAVLLGLLVGLLMWSVALGAHVRRHEPGLWTVRFDNVIACGLDYNGPPFTERSVLWLTCGEADGWQLWPWK